MAPPHPPVTTIHATCVALSDVGVLLLGPSGAGKSDLALRLIDRGAQLVADDRCELADIGGQLLCAPPAAIAGMIEVRGIGIVTRPWTAPVPIHLAVRLTERTERMPDPAIEEIGGHVLPAVRINALEASAAIKVELALAALTAP
jgi:HPr kinase/phosphorylase